MALMLLSTIAFMYSSVLLKSQLTYQALQDYLQLELERRSEKIALTRAIEDDQEAQLMIENLGSIVGEISYIVIKNQTSISIVKPEDIGMSSNAYRQKLPQQLWNLMLQGSKILLVTRRGNVFSLADPYWPAINEISHEFSNLSNNVSLIESNIVEIREKLERIELALSNSTTINVTAGDIVMYHPVFGLIISGEIPSSDWTIQSSDTISLGSNWNTTIIAWSKTGFRGILEVTVNIGGLKQVLAQTGSGFATSGTIWVNRPQIVASGSYLKGYPPGCYQSGAWGGAYRDFSLESGKYNVTAYFWVFGGSESWQWAEAVLYFASRSSDIRDQGGDSSAREGWVWIYSDVSSGRYRVNIELETAKSTTSLPKSYLKEVRIYRLGELRISGYGNKIYGPSQMHFTYNLKNGILTINDNEYYTPTLSLRGFNTQVSYTIRKPDFIKLYAPAGTQVYLDGVFIGEVTETYLNIQCQPDTIHELHVEPPST